MAIGALANDGWLLVQLVGVVAIYCLAVSAVVRWPVLGLILPATLAMTLWEWPQAPRITQVLGFTVYLDDVIVGTLAGALLVNLVRGRLVLKSLHVAALMLTLLMAASAVAGAMTFDLGAMVVEARPLLFVMVALLWGLSFSGEEAALAVSIGRVSMATALALIAVGVYHGAVHGLGTADRLILDDLGTIVQTGRILTSGQALLLGLSAMALVARPPETRVRFAPSIALVAAVVVVLSQQRTAALAIAVGVVAIFLRSRSVQRATFVAVAGVVAVVLVFAYALGLGEGLRADLADSASNTGTYEGRLGSWKALVGDATARGAAAIFFGRPFGSGFGRLEAGGQWVEFAPHNWYLTVFLRTGLIGLLVLVWLLVAALRRAWQLRDATWVLGGWVALAVFGWGYSWPWYVVPLLALGLAMPMVTPRARAPQRHSNYRRLGERTTTVSRRT